MSVCNSQKNYSVTKRCEVFLLIRTKPITVEDLVTMFRTCNYCRGSSMRYNGHTRRLICYESSLIIFLLSPVHFNSAAGHIKSPFFRMSRVESFYCSWLGPNQINHTGNAGNPNIYQYWPPTPYTIHCYHQDMFSKSIQSFHYKHKWMVIWGES